MKIVLWGATGLTGREVLHQALDGGHEVKAVARNPEQIESELANLTVVRGDALNPQSVQEAVAGGEVVISALGSGATLMQARKPTTLYGAIELFTVTILVMIFEQKESSLQAAGTMVARGTPRGHLSVLKF